MPKKDDPPISESGVQACIISADFWSQELGIYGAEMRTRADRYAIFSSTLSFVTGLGVWPALEASAQWPAVIAVVGLSKY